MATPGPAERIRTAIADAAARLAQQPIRTNDRDEPAPGDLYVFDVGEDIGLEWLVVRFHPDDPGLLLLAPADDFPFAGTPDITLPHDLVNRLLTVRCGETDWFPADFCTPRLRVGTVPEPALRLVRQRLADLARGRAIPTADGSIDLDPEYEEWIDEVSQSRVALLTRANAPRSEPRTVVPLATLSMTPPAQLASTPEFSLAADTGSELFAALNEALTKPDDVRYHEVPDIPDGKLFLVADHLGVRCVWEGPSEVAPQISAVGEKTPAEWCPSPEGQLHQTEAVFPWVDGQAVLVIGTVPPQTLAIQL
jgi:hypothetical protein